MSKQNSLFSKAGVRELARFYGWFSVVTALPFIGIAAFFRAPELMLGWLYLIAWFIALMTAATALLAVSAWPLVLLLSAICGGNNKGTPPHDPDGPGVVV